MVSTAGRGPTCGHSSMAASGGLDIVYGSSGSQRLCSKKPCGSCKASHDLVLEDPKLSSLTFGQAGCEGQPGFRGGDRSGCSWGPGGWPWWGGGRAVTLPPLLQGRNERNKPFLQILLSACSDLTSEVLSLRALAQVATRVPVCVLDLLSKALRPDTWAGTALVRSQQTTSGSGLGVGAVGI